MNIELNQKILSSNTNDFLYVDNIIKISFNYNQRSIYPKLVYLSRMINYVRVHFKKNIVSDLISLQKMTTFLFEYLPKNER